MSSLAFHPPSEPNDDPTLPSTSLPLSQLPSAAQNETQNQTPPPLVSSDLLLPVSTPQQPAPPPPTPQPAPPPPPPPQPQSQPSDPPPFTTTTTLALPSPPTPPVPAPAPPQPFTPLFTLITTPSSTTTPTTTTYHHPTVHYLFSDDADSDLLFTAIPPSTGLSAEDEGHRHPASHQQQQQQQQQRSERALIIDLDSSGTRVASAYSLTPEWAVVGAEVVVAPSWEPEMEREGGFMLRVEGVERGGLLGNGEGEGEGLEALRERWERGMEGLRRVVGREYVP